MCRCKEVTLGENLGARVCGGVGANMTSEPELDGFTKLLGQMDVSTH